MPQTDEALTAEMERFSQRAEDLMRELDRVTRQPSQGVNSSSNFNVNAGGVGGWVAAWIAATCCAAMLGAGVMFAISTNGAIAKQDAKIAELERKVAEQQREQERKTDEKLSRMQDYLNAIYSMAPQLKPKE